MANVFPRFLLKCMQVLSVVKSFLTDKIPNMLGSVESSDNIPGAFQKYEMQQNASRCTP